jgi:hypothetical protein
MNKVILYLVFITSVLSLKSQDFKQDLTAVVNQQNKLEKQCYNVTYTLRENHNFNSKVIQKSVGKYIKLKNSYLSAIDHVLSVNLPNEVIMIDSQQKKIVISKNDKKTVTPSDQFMQIDEYNKYISKMVVNQLSKNVVMYSVELKKNPYPISKYEIVIDTKLKSYVRLSLFYKGTLDKDDRFKVTGKEVPRMDIEFFDYNDFVKIKEIECTKSYYYTQIGNKLIPTDNYKGYEIKKY